MQHPFINDLVRFFGVTVPVIVAWVAFGAIALDWVLHWLMPLLFSWEMPTKEYEISAHALGFWHSIFIFCWIYRERYRAGRAEEQAGLLVADMRLPEGVAESAAFKSAISRGMTLRSVFLFFPLLILWLLITSAMQLGYDIIAKDVDFGAENFPENWPPESWAQEYIGGMAAPVFIFWWMVVVEEGIAKRRVAEWLEQSEQQSAQPSAG